MQRKKVDIDYFIFILFAISFLARIIFLGSLPGLHGDEAYFGLNTIKILSGDLVLSGMNSYTGPMFDYLRVPIFIFSKSVFALRLLSVLLNSLGPVWLYLILKKFYKRQSSFVVALLFSFMPWFFLSSRIAWEVTFFPSLIFLCIYLFIGRKYWSALSGLLCAFGLWTHAIFATALIPILVSGLVLSKTKKPVDLVKSGLYFVLGFAIGLAPRFIQAVRYENAMRFNSWDQTVAFFKASLRFIPQVLGGDILYLRQVGDVKISLSFYVLVFIGIATLLSVGALIKDRKKIFIPIALLAMFFLSILMASSVVPWITFRYLFIPLAILSLFFAFILAGCLDQNIGYYIIAAVIILLSAFSISTNFFFSKKDPSIKKFSYGTIEDTNAHFLDSFGLYKCLTNNMIKAKIVAKPLLARPLEFYDAARGELDIVEIDNIAEISDKMIYVDYKGEAIPHGFNLMKLDCLGNNFIVLKNY